MPNVLPKSIPWIDFARHKGFYINHHSTWPRHAGRLIWWTLIFTIGIVWAFLLDQASPSRPEPADLGADNSRRDGRVGR